MRIGRILAKRCAAAVPVLLFLTVVVFLLSRASGIDPARAELGPNATAAALAHFRHAFGLNRPIWIQYAHYVEQILQGNLGTSLRTLRPVASDLQTALPATIELVVFSSALAVLGGLVLGVTSSLGYRGSGSFRLGMIAGSSLPSFLLGIGGIFIFYGELGWLPAAGQTSYLTAPTGPTGFLLVDSLLAGNTAIFANALQHLILPATVLAVLPAVAIGRVLRNSASKNLGSDYVRTAQSKGLREWVIFRKHVLRNSLNAPLAMVGLELGLMFSSDIIVEKIFAWPGIGNYVAQSIAVNDYPVVAAVTLVVGVAYILLNVVVDILQAVADPRIEL